MSADTKTRLATLLLAKVVAISAQAAEIEQIKVQLRAIAKASGSFTETLAGGTVEVKAARPGKFNGTMPTLVPELYLAMTDAERGALVEAGVVKMAEQWGKPYSGSITVKPA